MKSIKSPLKIFIFNICIFSFMLTHFGCTPKPIIIKKELGYLNTPGAKEYPNAGAIMLLDSASDIIYENGEIISKIHQIIKILNDRGKDFGEISVAYNSSFQNAAFSFARTITSDGTIVLPSKEAFNEITPYAGYNLYSDIKQKVVSMPAVEPGSIIEYEAVIKSKPLLLSNGYSVDWFFQFSEPIMLSKYSITLPKKLPFKTTYYNFEQIPDVSEYKEYTTYTWEKLNINEIVTEPVMPSMYKIAPWMRITTAKSWDDMAPEFIKLIKESIAPDPLIKSKVKELIKNKTNSEEKIKALFYFIEKNIRYVGLEWGISSIKPHTASEIFKNAYGDCKDQSTLLITMLREAEIKAYPALLFSDNNDEIDLNTPTLSQFNHMIVYAETQEKTYWLDPTVEVGNINEFPGSNQNHTAWIIRDTDNKAEFKSTTLKSSIDYNRSRTIKAVISPDGSIKCDAKTYYTGDDAMQMRASLKYTEPEKYLQLFENLVNKTHGVHLL
ncbi:DUF3857 and transglutaminase domain-containing protein [Candidatus Desantisbacteria bacterium]|nr:DUF3857 and transglutaminase domain-containing protein [Candidatus Desantisbacteria bacterium]